MYYYNLSIIIGVIVNDLSLLNIAQDIYIIDKLYQYYKIC